jgi:hypothetical protein
MSARVAAALIWLAWVLSVASAVFGLFFLYLNGSFAPFFDESLGIDAAVAVTYSTVGAVIASRRRENAVGWLFCGIGLLHGITVFTGEYAKYALLTQPDTLPAGVAAAWLGTWVWMPGVVLNVTFLLLIFPHGRLPSRRWRPVAWLAAAAATLGSLSLAVLPWDLLNVGVPADNPFVIEGIRALAREIFIFVLVLGAVSVLLSVFSLVVRFHRARGLERQQLKWFVYAGGLYVLTIFVPISVIENLQILTATFLPIAVGTAILRHRLYDIDRIINRTLVYGALTASLAAVYVGSVVSLQSIFRALTGQESQLAVVASTLAIAALFYPLRRRIQDFIDRRFYRRKYDAKETLEAFSARLRDEVDLDHLAGEFVAVVRETVQPAHTSLWLRGPAAGPRRQGPGEEREGR